MRWMVLIVAVGVLTLNALAQPHIDVLAAWGGAVNGFQRVGNVGYCAAGQRLVVLDMTDEVNVHEIGSVLLAGVAGPVAVRGQYAYVGGLFSGSNGSGALVAVDVSNPSSPHIVWQESSPYAPYAGIPFRAQFYGNYLFLNSANYPVVYDISNPAVPVPTPGDSGSYLTTFGAGFHVRDIAIAGDLIYVACESPAKVAIFSLQPDPLHPGLSFLGQVAVAPGASWAAHIAVEGTVAAVEVRDLSRPNGNQDIVRLVDVSDPAHPAVMGTYSDVYRANSVAVSGHYAFVADWFGSITQPINGNLSRLKGLAILDITNPASPVLVGSYNTAHSSIRDVQVVGDRAYLFCGGQGLEVLDISNPAGPTRIGGYFSPAELRHMTRAGDLLYVVDQWNGFSILDVSNPLAPHVVGVYRGAGSIQHQQHRHVNVVGNLAYLAAGYGGIQVVDVSNPASPTLVSQYLGQMNNANAQCLSIEADGHFIHSVCQSFEPTGDGYINYALNSFTELNHVETYGSRLISKDGITFIGGSYGFTIVNDQSSILQSQVPGGADIEVVGNRLYGVASGMYIYDVTDPTMPAQLGYLPGVFGSVQTDSIGVSGNRAFLGSAYSLAAIDTSDVANPHLLAMSRTAGAGDIVAAGDIIYSTIDGPGSASTSGGNFQSCGGLMIRRLVECGTADFNGDGSVGTDADIQAFFACLAGSCCPTCGSPDFNDDGATGTDQDIESFFRVLSGGPC